MKNRIQAIVFKKVGENYQYLLLKRISSRGGFWQSVTGGCEQGESHLEAAKRELREETGISQVQRIIKDVYSFKLERDPNVEVFVFGFEVEPEIQILLDVNIYPEHDDFRWCDYEEAFELLEWPHDKEALRKLNRKLLELK